MTGLSIFLDLLNLLTPSMIQSFLTVRDRSLFIAWGGAEDLGGIRWLSKELGGGSAVIDRRKGGIRPKKWNDLMSK